MRKNLILFLNFWLMMFCAGFAQSNDGNGGGAVRISFGSGSEYVEPRTLSGDDPAVPPKPHRTFHTNSVNLNKILEATWDFEAMQNVLEKLKSSQKVVVSEGAECAACFTIVYNLETKEVVAVMDKGSGKRMNLLSNKFETNDLYVEESFGKILFELNE